MSIPDDTLLDDFLAGQGEVARAYRAAPAPAAPVALDAAILAAAQAAPRRVRDTRWRIPLAMVGSFVLGSALMNRLAQESSPVPDAAAPSATAAAALPRVPEMKKTETLARAQKPAPAPVDAVAMEAERAAMPAEAVMAESPMSDASPDPAGAALAREEAYSAVAADPVASTMAAESASAAPALAAAPAQAPAPAALAAAPAAERTAKAKARQAEAPPADAKAWLNRIRELQAKGETQLARQELQRFRERYPDRLLREDLKALEALPVE